MSLRLMLGGEGKQLMEEKDEYTKGTLRWEKSTFRTVENLRYAHHQKEDIEYSLQLLVLDLYTANVL